jgi:hypothetical protein
VNKRYTVQWLVMLVDRSGHRSAPRSSLLNHNVDLSAHHPQPTPLAIYIVMFENADDDVGRVLDAVHKARDDLKGLRTSRHSMIPSSLSKADVALDKLSCNLSLLTGSSKALCIFRGVALRETITSTTTSLSEALVQDMEAITSHLRSMKPTGSEKILGDLNEQECQNILELADCYDRTIFSVLTKHNVCV